MRLEPGWTVRCEDAEYGELADVVVDPRQRRVTHVVVQPRHHHGPARLVPVDVVSPDDAGRALSVSCSREELERLPEVSEFAYVRLDQQLIDDPGWEVGIATVLATPSYEPAGLEPVPFDGHVEMTYDRIPAGTVEIRHKSGVVDADGHRVGSVEGFAVDGDGLIAELVVDRGHLWHRRKVTVPVDAVAKVENDVVTLAVAVTELGRRRSPR
jgi:sporulation protein YlmC with PRC-barrel domain